MKIKRLLTVILALLTVLPSCTPAKNDDGEKETTPAETTVKFTIPDEPENPNLLTHVFSETELSFDGGIVPTSGTGVNIKDGKLSLFCTKEESVDGKYTEKFCLSTFDLNSSTREDRIIDIETDGFHPNRTLVTDEALFIVGNNYDQVLDKNVYVLVKYSLADGTIVEIDDIDSMIPKAEKVGYPGIMGMAQDKDGYVYLSGEHGVCVLNPDLTKSFECMSNDYIRSLRTSPDGEVYVTSYGASYKVDRETQTLGSSIPLPDDAYAEQIYFGEGFDCYFTTADGLYGYNFDSDCAEMIINWKNSSISYSTIKNISIVSPEEVFIEYSDPSSQEFTNHYSMYNKTDDIDISEITQVKAVYFADYNNTLPQNIINYNKANPTVYITGEDYAAYNTSDDMTGAVTKLVTEMVTGVKTPDIICLQYGEWKSVNAAITQIIENGLYADMYEFMETDLDIKKDDVMGVIKNTFEVDGKLAAVMPGFSVKSMVAPKSEVGELTSWNYEQVLDFIDSLPEGKKITDDTFTALRLDKAFDIFIDYENKTCDFDNAVCVELLEKYVELTKYREQAQENFDIYNKVSTMEPGIPVCCERDYSYVDSYQQDEALLGTKDYVRIGYPENKGSGSTISDGYVYIITKNAAHPKEAWEFIRSIILDKPEYDMVGGRNGIRMLRSQNELYKEDMKQYFKFFPIDTSRGGNSTATVRLRETYLDENGLHNGRAGTLVDFVESDYDAFLDFIDSAGSPISKQIPAELQSIIYEEIEVYKNDGRDAQKTAEILQSRVSIYLSERE